MRGATMIEPASNRKPPSFAGTLVAMVLAPLATGARAGPWEIGGTGIDSGYKAKIEVAYKDTASQTTWVRPAIGFAAPLNSRMSYELGLGHGVVEAAGDRSSGTRGLDMKLKWKLGDAARGLDWLVEPKLTIPIDDQASDIGAHKAVLEMPLRAGKALGKYYFTAEARYTHEFKSGYDSLVTYGGLIEYFPNQRWVVGLDLLSDLPIEGERRHHLRTNGAIKWRPTQRFEVQALLGRSIQNRRAEKATTAKVVVEYKF
ncbi:MAG: hypothetical protein EOP02_37985 [Proteobacteria bacterium]|nr:MAG: hypothetical protein EOP02_37985 [Pseudomonadota bacterium]